MRRKAFPGESSIGLLASEDVARATLRLIGSDLTGQVLDVRRHDSQGALPVAIGEGGAESPEPVEAAARGSGNAS
jgi:2-C-methyl-D-erythritol 4-phosphate cytidylyltransferase